MIRVDAVTLLKDGSVEVLYTTADENGEFSKEWGGTARSYSVLGDAGDEVAVMARVTQAVQAAFAAAGDAAVTVDQVLRKFVEVPAKVSGSVDVLASVVL